MGLKYETLRGNWCATCHAWDISDIDEPTARQALESVGECRRRSPQVVLAGTRATGCFPITHGSQGCMEWVDGKVQFVVNGDDMDLEF